MRSGLYFLMAALLITFCLTREAPAQIGGETSSTGDFVLEDVEDLDLFADSVERNWISQTNGVNPAVSALSAVQPSSHSLVLQPDQTPNGVFRMDVASSFGYADTDFGVPMPSVKGASTAVSPGNITSYEGLRFFATFKPALTYHEFIIVLECYPQQSDGKYPKLFWAYSPPSGDTFAPVRIDLRNPDDIINTTGKTIEELLGATRFLDFYFYAEGSPLDPGFSVYIDDIALEAKLPTSAIEWSFYN